MTSQHITLQGLQKIFNDFREELRFLTGVVKSGDGINHWDSKLNIEELNEKIREYHEG